MLIVLCYMLLSQKHQSFFVRFFPLILVYTFLVINNIVVNLSCHGCQCLFSSICCALYYTISFSFSFWLLHAVVCVVSVIVFVVVLSLQ